MNKDTPIFTVFGGTYVAEHHNGSHLDFGSSERSGAVDGWVIASTVAAMLTFLAAEVAFFATLGTGTM